MSKNFLVLGYGFKIKPLAAAPSPASDGDVYYDSTLSTFRIRESGKWNDIGGTTLQQAYDSEAGAEVTLTVSSAPLVVSGSLSAPLHIKNGLRLKTSASGHLDLLVDSSGSSTYSITLPGDLPGEDALLTLSSTGISSWSAKNDFATKFVGKNVYVDNAGSNTTGNGSVSAPYQTIGFALTQISDASPSNRYSIILQPGTYAHSGTLNLKPDIDIIGLGSAASGKTCRITAGAYALSTDWSGSGDKRLLVKNITLANTTPPEDSTASASGAVSINFNSAASEEGKVYFDNVYFETDLHITGKTQVNQCNISNCYLYWNYIQKGTICYSYNTTYWGYFSTIESYVSGLSTSLQSYFFGFGSTFIWDVNVNGPSGRSGVEVDLFNCGIGGHSQGASLNIDGPNAVFKATEDSFPQTSDGYNVTNGAVVEYLNDRHIVAPATDGSSGQVLAIDGSGDISWTSSLNLNEVASRSLRVSGSASGYVEIKTTGSVSNYTLTLPGFAPSEDSFPVITSTGSIAWTAKFSQSLPQNTQTSSYTLVLSDVGKHVAISSGGITVPANVFSTGNVVTIYNNSSSPLSLLQGNDTTLRLAGTATTGSLSLAQYGVCSILCVSGGSNPTFVASGTSIS